MCVYVLIARRKLIASSKELACIIARAARIVNCGKNIYRLNLYNNNTTNIDTIVVDATYRLYKIVRRNKDMHVVAGSGESKNILNSIQKHVSIKSFEKYCDKNTINKIKSLYPDDKIYLWALSNEDNMKNRFELIKESDLFLIKVKGQKFEQFFNFYGEIVYKLEINNIGEEIWGSPNWTRLIFLKNIKKIHINTKTVSMFIVKRKKYTYQNVIVKEPRLEDVLLSILNNNINEVNNNR